MPKLDFEDDFDADLDGDEAAPEEQPVEDEEVEQEEEPDASAAKGPDERVRKLQSEKDKETARANKAEKALAALQGRGNGSNEGHAPAQVVPAEVQIWLDAARTGTRSRLYDSDPRFKAYGVDPTFIEGSTPDEMEATFRATKRMVDRMESRVRAAVLQEHGISPEPRSGTPMGSKAKSFADMSKEEFDAVVARATSG